MLALSQSVNVSQYITKLKTQQKSCGKGASRIMENQSLEINPDAIIETSVIIIIMLQLLFWK